jgi:hemoglobin-like flavoprotein
MTDDIAVIIQTLEQVAERVGDPMKLVFQRLFEEMPEVEALFVQDKDALVRGQMFQVTVESLLDFLGDRSYGASLIQIERMNHQGLGVETKVFDRFYPILVDTFRDILAEDWTTETDAVWTRVVRELTGIS